MPRGPLTEAIFGKPDTEIYKDIPHIANIIHVYHVFINYIIYVMNMICRVCNRMSCYISYIMYQISCRTWLGKLGPEASRGNL